MSTRTYTFEVVTVRSGQVGYKGPSEHEFLVTDKSEYPGAWQTEKFCRAVIRQPSHEDSPFESTQTFEAVEKNVFRYFVHEPSTH